MPSLAGRPTHASGTAGRAAEMRHLVCIGHAKCGTTLLDSVFRQSRLVGTPSETKEIKFFLPRFFPEEAAHEHYLEKFATADGGHPVVATFEASPQYSHQPKDVLRAVLENIRQTLPGAKVVICFRHPVLRAYSHYIHNLHTFALYGEGVFTPRPDLLRKPCRMSFEEALASTTRLQVSYSTTLRVAYEVMGRENVLVFFVERDAASLSGWMSRHLGRDVADDLSGPLLGTGTVFGRRPIPGYFLEDGVLHAYGSQHGEYVRYEGGSPAAVESVLQAAREWTLAIEPEDISRLTEEHFRADLLQCEELSREEMFREYLEGVQERQSAEITPRALLDSLHGVTAAS
jgi:hypothetical protein